MEHITNVPLPSENARTLLHSLDVCISEIKKLHPGVAQVIQDQKKPGTISSKNVRNLLIRNGLNYWENAKLLNCQSLWDGLQQHTTQVYEVSTIDNKMLEQYFSHLSCNSSLQSNDGRMWKFRAFETLAFVKVSPPALKNILYWPALVFEIAARTHFGLTWPPPSANANESIRAYALETSHTSVVQASASHAAAAASSLSASSYGHSSFQEAVGVLLPANYVFNNQDDFQDDTSNTSTDRQSTSGAAPERSLKKRRFDSINSAANHLTYGVADTSMYKSADMPHHQPNACYAHHQPNSFAAGSHSQQWINTEHLYSHPSTQFFHRNVISSAAAAAVVPVTENFQIKSAVSDSELATYHIRDSTNSGTNGSFPSNLSTSSSTAAAASTTLLVSDDRSTDTEMNASSQYSSPSETSARSLNEDILSEFHIWCTGDGVLTSNEYEIAHVHCKLEVQPNKYEFLLQWEPLQKFITMLKPSETICMSWVTEADIGEIDANNKRNANVISYIQNSPDARAFVSIRGLTPQRAKEKIIAYFSELAAKPCTDTFGNDDNSWKVGKDSANARFFAAIRTHIHTQQNPNILVLDGQQLRTSRALIDANITRPEHIHVSNICASKQQCEIAQKLQIHFHAQSVQAFLITTKEMFHAIWLDYCGTFSTFAKDYEVLFRRALLLPGGVLAVTHSPRAEKKPEPYISVMQWTEDRIKHIAHINGQQLEVINHVSYGTVYQICFRVFPLEISSSRS